MRNGRIRLPILGGRQYGREDIRGGFENAWAAQAVIRDVFEQADRGYLEVLDANSTFFDYDGEVDEMLLDLDFRASKVSRQRAARGRPGR